MEGDLKVTKSGGAVRFILTFLAAFGGCMLALFLVRYVGSDLQGKFVGEMKPRLNVNRKTE